MRIIVNNANTRTIFHAIQFSDTHVFYTEDASEDAFEIIIKSSLVFMLMAAIRKHPYLPLRGAINYGDFRVDQENSIFVGKALRDAYVFEKSQEWMGCFLSDLCYEQVKNYEIFKEFLKKLVLVKYPVPFKNATNEEGKYVINMEAFPRVYGEESKDCR